MGQHPILQHVDEERELLARVRAWADERERTLDEIQAAAERLEPVRFEPASSPPPAVPKVEKPRQQARPQRVEARAAAELGHPTRPARHLSSGAERRARLLQFIRANEPVSAGRIREGTGTSVAATTLVRDLAELRRDGLVQMTGERGGARYWSTEGLDAETAKQNGTKGQLGGGLGHRERQCRDFVLSMVRKEPGRWSERSMAEGSDFYDREAVAVACGRLLEEGELELLPDGTYRPAAALSAA